MDRIPSLTLVLADPSGSLFATYERGHGFRGATVTFRIALYDPSTGDYTSDFFTPFVGLCDAPACDEATITITANSKLNFSRFQFPTVPIQVRCPWINPTTIAQRASLSASPTTSPYRFCGETRDLTTAPPCAYNLQTCTRVHLGGGGNGSSYGGSTWQPAPDGSGREYISGNWQSWHNADTSGKYQEFWPLWLGGMAWLSPVALNQFGDGNYARGEAAVAFGAVNVQRVMVNNEELSQGGKDFFWGYSNNGDNIGVPNPDAGYNGQGDSYGNETVVEYRAPKSVLSPESAPNLQLLCGPSTFQSSVSIATQDADHGVIHIHLGRSPLVTDPGDGTTVRIVGVGGSSLPEMNGTWTIRYVSGDDWYLQGSLANGSGTLGTMFYNRIGQSGGARTSDMIQTAISMCGVPIDETDSTLFTAAGTICDGTITYTDSTGASQTQARFSSAVAIRQRTSASEVIRGLRQSIGAQLFVTQAGLIGIRIEGPLCEQQSAPVDGSNYNTAISSTARDGSTVSGYTAYDFDEANSWDLKRIQQPISQNPNQVSFPFQDPTQQFAISNFSLSDSDDVARIGYATPGALQVQPVGIASYNHALRCGKLGLAKILRGNPAGDTKGTDMWNWKASFRACKVRVGDIVTLTSAKYSMTKQMVRLTQFKPTKDFATIEFQGTFHDDGWYLDSHGNSADPGYTITGRQPVGATVPPTFAVEQSAGPAHPDDPTVALVLGLAFSDPANTFSISSGAFSFYYVDEPTVLTTLAANLGTGDVAVTLTDSSAITTDIAAGKTVYIQIGKEIALCADPTGGGVVPITRAQLGSTAVSATSGDNCWMVLVDIQTVSFPLDFVNTPAYANWSLSEALPNKKLLSVGGVITNAYAPSGPGYTILTGSADDGLKLTAPSASSVQFTTIDVTPNTDYIITTIGNLIVNVVATTRDCVITLPSEAPDSGNVIYIVLAAGSTFNAIRRVHSGDTVDTSSSDFNITPTNPINGIVGN